MSCHPFTAASYQSQSREDVGPLALLPSEGWTGTARNQDWGKTQAPVPQYTLPFASCMSLGPAPHLHLHEHRSAESGAAERVSETGTRALLGQNYRMTGARAENHLREREKGSTGSFIAILLVCWVVMLPAIIMLIKGLLSPDQSAFLRNIICSNKREFISSNLVSFESVAHHGCSNSSAVICLHSAELQ